MKHRKNGSIAILVEAEALCGLSLLCSCTISPASAVAASRRQVVPLPTHHGPLTSERGSIPSALAQDRKMLQLLERLDHAMRSKGEKWRHDLDKPITGITKQGGRLTPPKLRLIRKNSTFSIYQ